MCSLVHDRAAGPRFYSSDSKCSVDIRVAIISKQQCLLTRNKILFTVLVDAVENSALGRCDVANG